MGDIGSCPGDWGVGAVDAVLLTSETGGFGLVALIDLLGLATDYSMGLVCTLTRRILHF